MMPCRRPSSLPLLVQAYVIIACLYYHSATLPVVVAQEAEVENPCLICPYGATRENDYEPYASKHPITCKEIIDNAKLFETGSFWCAQYEEAGLHYCCPTTPDDPCTVCPNGITVADNYEPYNDGKTCATLLDYYAANFDAESDWCTVGRRASDIESRCCPTVANNPCTICPDGITAGEDILPYTYDWRTCKDIINATSTFDAESEMCLVWAKQDEYYCCPSNTTTFDDYCNICPDGITAGDDFIPWSVGATCKQLVEDAKIIYKNGSVGCNYYKGYEKSCCPTAGTDISPPIGTPETATATSMCTDNPHNGYPETAQTSSMATPDTTLVHKVRVQLMGTNYLHMREVQVFDTSGVNHALNKLATQSSSWGVEIRSDMNKKCLAYDGNNHAVFMWECTGGSNQQWYWPSSKRIEADGNRCLDAPGGALYRVYWHWCHDGQNQKWTYDDMGRLHSVAYPHLCLDLCANNNTNGAVVGLYQCNNDMNQKWLAFDFQPASDAVNGNLTDLSHTLEEAGAWWEVDLGEDVAVSRVVIYNRIENSDRLSKSIVSLINYQGTAVKTWRIDDATCKQEFYCDFLQPTTKPISTSSSVTTPDTDPWKIVEVISAVIGAVAALVGAAFALARWKNKNLSSAVPTTVAPSTNIMTSSIPIVTATAVPQSTNVYNTPMPSQPNELQGPRRSSLVWSRSFSSRI